MMMSHPGLLDVWHVCHHQKMLGASKCVRSSQNETVLLERFHCSENSVLQTVLPFYQSAYAVTNMGGWFHYIRLAGVSKVKGGFCDGYGWWFICPQCGPRVKAKIESRQGV